MFSLENNPAGRSESVPKPHDADHRADLSGLDETEDPQEALAAFQAGLSEQLAPFLTKAEESLARAQAMKESMRTMEIKCQDLTLSDSQRLAYERELEIMLGEHSLLLEAADQFMDEGEAGGEAERKAA